MFIAIVVFALYSYHQEVNNWLSYWKGWNYVLVWPLQ